MAFSESLADRIREYFEHFENVEEKKMMGGLIFMVNEKMCVGVIGDELMCRVDPTRQNDLVEKPGCRTMDMAGKRMRGFLVIDESGLKNARELKYWMDQALHYNPLAKKSKK